MFLDYLALFILLLAVTLVIYVFFAIHDIPHHIAKKRNHPQQDAIGAACWLSLFTLHALWPFVFIWAMTYRPKVDIDVTESSDEAGGQEHVKKRMRTTLSLDPNMSLAEMRHLIQAVGQRIEAIEREQNTATPEQEVKHV